MSLLLCWRSQQIVTTQASTLLLRSVINKLAKPFSCISRNDGSENRREIVVSLIQEVKFLQVKKAASELVYEFLLLNSAS